MMLDHSMIPISVLDTVPISSGQDATQALQAVTQLAGRLDEWGYHRYWLAEHHGFLGNAASSPPVLTAHLAARTARIRVGAGGVLLPNHPPLIVAEQFGTLEALHPGRIDLGIGRGHGATPAAAAALGRSMDQIEADAFARQLDELLSYFRGDAPATAVPGAGLQPQLWMLGSGMASAQLAGKAGLPFAFAHHFFGEKALAPALATYRESFRPSPFLDRPHVLISVWALCAETDAQARGLALPGVVAFLNVIRGRSGPVPTGDEAAAYRGSAEDHQFIDARLDSHVILGAPGTVRDRVAEFVARTGADELMATTVAYGAECRLRSFGLLAEALNVSGSRLPVGAQ